ncbi:MAG: tRNA pseudouridine(38-40) synthase TruA [Candidatus Binatia bacterium]
MNIKLTVEYDGTNYHGWQMQPNADTIQSALERALSVFFAVPIRITGSGRTDAGVHALGQVANFHTDKQFDRHRLLRGLNALTPRDITIRDADAVADVFDARRAARARIYRYQILNRSTPSPFHRNRAWHLHEPLDIEAIRAAISCLLGEHDFTSFRAAGCDADHAVRTVYQTSLEKRGDLVLYTIEATAFLRHMVRNIVGSLVEVGHGIRRPDSFTELLAARDRTQAGLTAPAHGLFLMEVIY